MTSRSLALLVAFLCVRHLAANGCGTPQIEPAKTDSKIVGGQIARAFSWPWQGALLRSHRFYCGATLIDRQWVMTAGHCVFDLVQRPDIFSVLLGVFNIRNHSEPGQALHDVAEIHLHPHFTDVSMGHTTSHDIALLKLNVSVHYTDHIQPVCLPITDTSIVNSETQAVITGWGQMGIGRPPSPQLRQVTVPFVKWDVCLREYPHLVQRDNMLCAGTTGKAHCHGDSGGPLVHKHGQQYFQYGIVSWSHGCGLADNPGVFGRVKSFCSFIKTVVGRQLCKTPPH